MIANYALIDENNIITNVIVIDDADTDFIAQLNAVPVPEGKWIGDALYDVNDAIKDKTAELSTTCNAIITQGVDVETSNGQDHFNLDLEDQSNINNLFRVVELGGTEYPYQADNGKCTIYTAQDIAKIYIAAQSHITQQLTYYHALVDYIHTLETVEEVQGINYGYELPEEYQTEVEAKLAVAKTQMEAIVAKLNQMAGSGTES